MTRTLRRAYTKQRYQAGCRKIPWRISYEEWLNWWIKTGHLEERGCRRGNYVMARKGDIGPYSLDNIICIQVHENNIGFIAYNGRDVDAYRSEQGKTASALGCS